VGDTWITDISHFFDKKRGLPDDLPTPARNLANHIGSIIAVVSSELDVSSTEMKVRCRRRPNRKPCTGEIEHIIEPGDERIFWRCPVCDDKGVISNWKGTIWDCRKTSSVN
jgi:hypothetical protein